MVPSQTLPRRGINHLPTVQRQQTLGNEAGTVRPQRPRRDFKSLPTVGGEAEE